MLLLLAVAAALFVERSVRRVGDVRSGAILGAVAFGAMLTAITELLSLGSAFGRAGIALAWLLVCVLLGAWWLRDRARGRSGAGRAPAPQSAPGDPHDRAAAGALAALAIVTLLTALLAAPNTFDSMTYHMSRVMHWLTLNAVEPYPTHILRQLHQTPWAEYAIAHAIALSGTDRSANLVQWTAYAGCALAASLIARELGATRGGQLAAAIVTATVPMAILQATSTKNDLVVAFWLACGVALFLRMRSMPGARSYGVWLALGAALGLAALTKATAYLLALPFAVWAGVWLLRMHGVRRALLPASIAAAAFVSINAGHYARNMAVYGSPLGPRDEATGYTYANETFSPGAFVSNVLRNASLHFGTPVGAINRRAERVVRAAHWPLRINPNDPRTTWLGMDYWFPHLSLHEDHAGAPLHVLLLTASAAYIVRSRRADAWRAHAGVVACIAAGFLLFCLYLKWQPWHTRLHLPLFVLASPLAGVALDGVGPAVRRTVVLLFVAASLPWLLRNESRPLIGGRSVLVEPRETQYFANFPAIREPYVNAASFLAARQCGDAGLILDWNGYEYPLWPLLRARRGQPVRFRHVLVANESAGWRRRAVSESAPCAVVLVSSRYEVEQALAGSGFRAAWQEGPVVVYLEEETMR